MSGFETSKLPADLRPVGVWAASLLQAIARDEVNGRRTARLTERNLDTWRRFRGRLTSVDFAWLLLEDAAVIHPMPFDPSTLGERFSIERLPESIVDDWLAEAGRSPAIASGAEYIADQARLLGVTTRLARSDLHVVKLHQKVLELPGTGGQLAYHLISTQNELTLQNNFVVACGTWQELTLAGIIGLELAAPRTDFAPFATAESLRDAAHPIRQQTFDFVVGVHPDKGGSLRAPEQLALWFPTAKIVLV